MQLWSSREYFQAEWRKLDPQPGDCFALFRAKDNFRGIILIEKATRPTLTSSRPTFSTKYRHDDG